MKKILFFFIVATFLLTGCGPQPKIQVSGVENSKVYPNSPIIHLDEQLAGDFTLTLNNQPIKNDYKVRRDGDYQLTIKAKKWWNEQTKTIEFSLDSTPPRTPRFEELLQESYYEKAKFTLKKEDGVTYTVKLDHEPFDLDEVVSKEGTHVLNIIAEKDNGLLSEQTVEFFIDNTTYSKDTYQRFEKFVFDNNGETFYFPTILKWLNNVDVFVHGNPTKTDMKMLKKHLNTLNEMLPIKFILQEDGVGRRENKLDVYFVPNYQFKDYGFQDDIQDGEYQVVGFSYPTNIIGDGEIVTSNVAIATNTDQAERNTTILHELIHSLGLYNHFNNDKTSIMYPYDIRTVRSMNAMDKQLIEILYREDIHPGMYRSDVKHVLKDRIK